MKKLFLTLIALMVFRLLTYSQGGDAIDKLFEKYSGKEGITSVYISSRMFSLDVHPGRSFGVVHN